MAIVRKKTSAKLNNGHVCLVRCDVCGKEAWRKASWAERSLNHYCSLKCRSKNPENHPRWKGGKRVAHDGYVLIKDHGHPNAQADGYVLEHRYIMAENLGRPLEAWEVVHHKNNIRDDNRIENLELLPEQASHLALQRMEARIRDLEKEVSLLKKENKRLRR